MNRYNSTPIKIPIILISILALTTINAAIARDYTDIAHYSRDASDVCHSETQLSALTIFSDDVSENGHASAYTQHIFKIDRDNLPISNPK